MGYDIWFTHTQGERGREKVSVLMFDVVSLAPVPSLGPPRVRP